MSATPEVIVTTTEGSGDNATSPDSSATSSATPAPPAMSPEIQKVIITATDLLKLGNAKAMALIAVHVGLEQLSFIANAKTAFEQWRALKRVYEPAGTAQLAALCKGWSPTALSKTCDVAALLRVSVGGKRGYSGIR